MIESILNKLNFKPEEIKTYLLLLEVGPRTAGTIAKKIGIPRSTLYGSLKKLVNDGLVLESQKHGIKLFFAENPEKINLLFNQKIETLQKNQIEFKELLPALRQKQGEKFLKPRLQLFEDEDGLKNILKDMLLYYDMETQAFWPQKKMVELLKPDFFRYHNKERIKNNLSVRAIWPKAQTVSLKDHPYFGIGNLFKREIRIAPEYIDFTMGYWIYGNKIAFLSSLKESFGFIIESREMAEMLKAQFEVIWKISSGVVVS